MSTSGVAWPSGVPFVPLRNGFSRTRMDNRVRFQPEVGEAKTRRRHTAVPITVDMTIRMSETDYLTLDDWYRDDLKDGSLRALFPKDPVEGDAFDCKFVAPPTIIAVGGFSSEDGTQMFDVSFTVHRLP